MKHLKCFKKDTFLNYKRKKYEFLVKDESLHSIKLLKLNGNLFTKKYYEIYNK